jgi:transposase
MLTRPEDLEHDQQTRLKQVLAHCAQLDAAAAHVTAFTEMMCGRHGERLDPWTAAVEADDLPELHRFTAGLRRDHDAVAAGLSMPHKSGAVEGTAHKIKMLKRQMFGRATSICCANGFCSPPESQKCDRTELPDRAIQSAGE